jgi:glucose/arabinose dehydrogenase
MPRRLLTALVVLLALPSAAHAHRDHCTSPPDPVNQAGDLRLTDLGTIGSLTGVVSAPGEPGRVYLAGLHGLVWVMENDVVRPEPFLDIGAEVSPTVDIAENERGLQSIAFPPDYATSRRFYVFTSDAVGDTLILEFRTTPDGRFADPATRRTVMRVPHSFARRHYGGQLAFGPDGRLYASFGDANRANYAQRRSTYGSVISFDPDRPRATRRWLAMGLRNPYRFAFDPFRGGLAIADVGEAMYDEINVLPRGFRGRPNYGWPYYEGPRRHFPKKLKRYVRPKLAYSHRVGTAVIGGPFVRDPRLPAYRGRYLYGDFCDGFVAVAALRRERPTTRMSGLVVPGLTTFGEDALHRIYLGSAYGKLYRLDPV